MKHNHQDISVRRDSTLCGRARGGTVACLIALAGLAAAAAAQDSGPGGLFDRLKDVVDTGAEVVGDALGISPDEMVRAMGRAKDKASRDVTRQAYEASPISIDDEWAYGAALGEAIRKELPLSQDQQTIDMVNRLAAPILERLERTKGRQYTFSVVEEDVLNAFAMLGGHVYIYRGLLDAMGTETAIQSVIAHEIAHVEREHCVMGSWPGIKLAEQTGNEVLAGMASNAFNQLLVVGYSEDQEHECDEFAYRTQAEMGVPKQKRLRFVRVLKANSAGHGEDGEHEESTAGRTATESIGDELARHYRTHPSGQERIDHLEALDLP